MRIDFSDNIPKEIQSVGGYEIENELHSKEMIG